ncbi:MAG TPA: hypothetical protein PLQ97_09710 [Myxococcota bacterium]|nr:hypothetical protein [Myxococcota bacterium]HQK51153.1 hypothetical protein [Myxococcota bacterium]
MGRWLAIGTLVLLLMPVAGFARGGRSSLKLERCLERCETNCEARCEVRHLKGSGAARDCQKKCQVKEKRCKDRCEYHYKAR